MHARRLIVAVAGLIAAVAISRAGVSSQAPVPERITAGEAPYDAGTSSGSAIAMLRAAAAQLDARVASGDLHRTTIEADPLVAGRMHERLSQYYKGVLVFGADATRQLNSFGQTTSVFSVFYPDIAMDVRAVVTSAEARALAGLANGPGAVVRDEPRLVVLPVNGGYRLAWNASVGSLQDGMIYRTFIDAVTGEVTLSFVDTWTQAAVGRGVGLAGDALAINSSGPPVGPYRAIDLIRPGGITTYDLSADASRTVELLVGLSTVDARDVATSATNSWTGEVASAHAYAGLTLDYFRRRFGRAGLDNHDIPIRLFVDVARAQAPNTPRAPNRRPLGDVAFYAGGGDVFFGAGSLSTDGGVHSRPYAAGLDVVAHELSHGITRFTSNLLYQFEAGALNEAFADMMGAAVEFMWEPVGDGPAKADWTFGEDVSTTLPLRSFRDPHALGAPDHYSLKRVTMLSDDNGGVHANASIVDHAYYLAIMGGTNRVSQVSVRGVGWENREQIERVIYRAFTELLPANATFAAARAATIQAARDLYGAGSAPETALGDAWAAIGVS